MYTQHRNPNPGHEATAPYNFVPLPDKIVTVVSEEELVKCKTSPELERLLSDRLPDFNRYDIGHHTGYFQVTLETLTPLYIRTGLSNTPPAKDQLSEYQRAIVEKTGAPPKSFREAVKNKPDFFYTTDPNQPVIPGSSLRGMLRNLLEIVSYSKVQWVTEKRLFYRSVADKHYQERMVKALGDIQVGSFPKAPGYAARVRGGFFRIRPNGTFEIEECTTGRIEMKDVLAAFKLHSREQLYELSGRDLITNDDKKDPNQTPQWKYQHSDIWVDIDPADKDYFFPAKKRYDPKLKKELLIHPDLYLRFRRAANAESTPRPNTPKQKGKLVLTGHMGNKHLAFVFIPTPKPKTWIVPNDPEEQDLNKRLVDRFQDDDQITPWQERAFPDGQPNGVDRKRNGYMRDGEPVFFLTDRDERGGNVVFFGRAQMFRLPYQKRPLDLVPEALRRPTDIDLAEAIFGFVRDDEQLKYLGQFLRKQGLPELRQGGKLRSYASRVFVTDAVLGQNQSPDIWLSQDPIAPKILATPKPTAFQHYLVQTSDRRRELKHYDSPSPAETTIRGHKLYWHQGRRTLGQIKENDLQWLKKNGEVKDESTQHTQFRPVKPEVTFSFRVYFEDLSTEELGALCWVLQLPSTEYCHSLGMGKPLGMGAVRLTPELCLRQRTSRYQELFDGERWNLGRSLPFGPGQDPVSRFEKLVLERIGESKKRLSDVPRIQCLLKLLEWCDADSALERKQYMNLDKFKKRQVLPDPLHI